MFRKGGSGGGGGGVSIIPGSHKKKKRQQNNGGGAGGGAGGVDTTTLTDGGAGGGGLSIFDELALSPTSRGFHRQIDDNNFHRDEDEHEDNYNNGVRSGEGDYYGGGSIDQDIRGSGSSDEKKNDHHQDPIHGGRGTKDQGNLFNYPSQEKQQQQEDRHQHHHPGLSTVNGSSKDDNATTNLKVSTSDSLSVLAPEAMIYAAPTVDTLGDGSSMLQYYNNTIHNNNTSSSSSSVSNRHHPHMIRSVLSTSSSSTLNTNAEDNSNIESTIGRIRQRVLQQNTEIAGNDAVAAATLRKKNSNSNDNNKDKDKKTKKNNNEFQVEEDTMTVSVRRVPVSERSAFNKKLPTDCYWDNNKNHSNADSSASSKKKISPSLQHWRILQRLSNTSQIRQVSFSPSVGPSSDVFWNESSEEEENDLTTSSSAATTVNKKRDGRYRSIHPVQGTISSLPDVPPMLSNKKHRLPLRTDVGFPNPTTDEIEQKQSETRMETEWEEASPRLIVLVTSDDLGKAVDGDGDYGIGNNGDIDGDSNMSSTASDVVEGLPGMPWAGADLIEAKARNQRHFELKGRQQQQNDHRHRKSGITKQLQDIAEQRRTSMLAPPLDATYSASSLGWRPRPFHDRPAGLRYALVSPLAVDFAVGNNLEPLICSLTLYWFPQEEQQMPNTSHSESRVQGGKVSEEFYFPAGDWEGKIQIDAIGSNGSNSDQLSDGDPDWATKEELLRELWGKRKQKALFSYDPLMLGGECSEKDLYVVFQVYKVSHPGAKTPYVGTGLDNFDSGMPSVSQSARKSWKKRLKKQFQKETSSARKIGGDYDSTADTTVNDIDIERTYVQSNAIFETYGTQLTTSLCFGITNLFPDGSTASSRGNIWPRGQVQQGMNLYAASGRPESQEDFEVRLRNTIFPPETLTSIGALGCVGERYEGDAVGTAIDPIDTTGFMTPQKKKGSIRKFMTPRLSSKKEVVSSSLAASSSGMNEPPVINGSVTLFSSSLGLDFLQAMLVTPPELIDKISISFIPDPKGGSDSGKKEVLMIPRVLVDASGGSAIMIDPNKSIHAFSNDDIVAKRSELVRLPTSRPAEFLDSSEFREVLFLPPRLRKRYDLDFVQADQRSLLNLLYLYPRSLTVKNHKGSRQNIQDRFTVRVQLIQNRSTTAVDGTVESANHALPLFHNPAAWGGSTLLRSVYTRLNCDTPGYMSDGHVDENQIRIPLRDEHKLDLPTVLDGSYFLQFSLFAVEFVEDLTENEVFAPNEITVGTNGSYGGVGCRLDLRLLGETSVPLSSSSIKDAKSGAKATTIIPNGTHRIRLGDYQLQVETRLVSSIHISDPSIAATLRDFPSLNDGLVNLRSDGGNVLHEQFASMGGGRNSVLNKHLSTAQGGPSSQDLSLCPTMFSTVSGSAIAGHFQPLLAIHMLNLISTSRDDTSHIDVNNKFLTENVQSLLILLWRVKDFFSSSLVSTKATGLRTFIKSAIDTFDESSFSASPNQTMVEDSASVVDDEDDGFGDDFRQRNEPEFDGGAIRKRKKQSLGNLDVLRISRSMSAMDPPDAPISRVAFGASKTDRMRLEAEMEFENARHTQLFDDDETVVTIATTRQMDSKIKEVRYSIDGNKNQESGQNQNDAEKKVLVTPTESTGPNEGTQEQNSGLDFSIYQKSVSELDIGKRMKNAAQIMLAPCVMAPPALSSVLLCRPMPGQGSSSIENNDSVSGVFRTDAQNTGSSIPSERKTVDEDTRGDIVVSGSEMEDDENEMLDGGDTILQSFHTTKGLFRSPRTCNTIQFSIPHNWMSRKSSFPVGRGTFLYETLMVLWIDSWLNHMNATSRELPNTTIKDSSLLTEESNTFAFYFQQMDVLLPLILKSIVLRYGQTVHMSQKKSARVVLDAGHQRVFETFFEMLALGLMGDAMEELVPNTHASSLSFCDLVVDFIIGLFPVVHPAHMETFITKFIKTLRACETNQVSKSGMSFHWDQTSLHRAKSSRQLRLRTIEKLSTLPNFVALNFPPKFLDSVSLPKSTVSTCNWTNQPNANDLDPVKEGSDPLFVPLVENDNLRPTSGWLASLLAGECLSICALSCEAVVAEALAHIEMQDTSQRSDRGLQSSLKSRPTASLRRSDLLMFQSIAIHAITCVHELLLRRHAMDRRFQKDSSRERVAALFLQPIFDKSIASVRWLARMESTHKVRSIWMLCFVYVLQEAPESLIRKAIGTYSMPQDLRIHRFIRLLRLGSSTFQSFVDQKRHCMFPLEIDQRISPWLLQESFNILCATTIVVVEESANPISELPNEQRKMMQGILDLLLHVLTTPQSSVTHLRAVGGAIQALDKFGASLFIEITGQHLQHWVRVVLSLMNNTALSVRSISVDFVVSFLGGIFDTYGGIDEISVQLATILPEVVAREVGLCAVNGLVKTFQDVEKALWPLRRSFADLEDANPLDDSRVDPQLSPILGKLSRTCQAIIDGVIIELRLLGNNCTVAGVKLMPPDIESVAFDADEESLYEAAAFFEPETAPIQRIRWLMTLKELHVEKGNWIEAAECLILCAKTVIDSMPYLNSIWRPSRFSLWSDGRRSLWLSTVGEEVGNPHQGNAQVMAFAGSFLEPSWLAGENQRSDSLKLPQPSLASMSQLLTNLTSQAVSLYSEEGAVDGLTYYRLEAILQMMMAVLDKHQQSGLAVGRRKRSEVIQHRKKIAEEEASLRQAIATLTIEMTKHSEKLLLNARKVVGDESSTAHGRHRNEGHLSAQTQKHHFVRMCLYGAKPSRFLESTSLPTFLEWDQTCVCRVPKVVVERSLEATLDGNSDQFEAILSTEFSKLVHDSLLRDVDATNLVVIAGNVLGASAAIDETKTYLNVCLVQPNIPGTIVDADTWWDGADFQGLDVRHFVHQRQTNDDSTKETEALADSMTNPTVFVETTVALAFPCALSRQRSMATSEFLTSPSKVALK